MEGRPRNLIAAWQSPDHNVSAIPAGTKKFIADCLHSTPHDITPNGSTDAFSDDEAESSWFVYRSRSKVDDRVCSADASASAHCRAIVIGPNHAVGSREHRRCLDRTNYAESSVRPLRRRAPRMARPARVRMRRRKPCTLARRRLFGWKVLLLIVIAPRPSFMGRKDAGMPYRQ